MTQKDVSITEVVLEKEWSRLREGMDSDLERLCASLVHEEEIRRNILKIKNELVKYKVSSMSIFRRVPADYYHKSLQERGILLNCKPEQLCKSILFENTVCGHENCDDTHDSRYYVVIVQYVRKIDTDLLSSALAHLVKDKKSKIKCNFRLVSEETSHQLTSYQHNAVTVYGMWSTISLTHSITHSLTHSLRHESPNSCRYLFQHYAIESQFCVFRGWIYRCKAGNTHVVTR